MCPESWFSAPPSHVRPEDPGGSQRNRKKNSELDPILDIMGVLTKIGGQEKLDQLQ